MLAALFHLLFAEETAAEEGRKVVLIMLATGGVFVCVIALGEAAHWADIAHERLMTRDPPRAVKDALHRLARASGATRREQRAPTAWETTSSQ